MLEAIIDYLEQGESVLAYLVLAASAGAEYVMPPFPGDTISLFGAFLAATAGYSALWVHLAMTAGSVAGSMMTWSFGRAVGRHHERWPRFLRRPRIESALDRVVERFGRHGAAYLAINRFVPALRGFFFLAAGMHGMHPVPVAVWGGVSAALWNALILLVGYSVGKNWERLQALGTQYLWISLGLIVIGGFIALLVAWERARRSRRDVASSE